MVSLSSLEKSYLNKKAIVLKDLDYGGAVGIVYSGSEGIIVDFGLHSGHPLILLADDTKVLVPWDCLAIQ